jgi:chromosome segregation protein
MLKSLDLFGFKSFADRTRFEFAPVTCVVVPAGRQEQRRRFHQWILGDQSPRACTGRR